MFLKRLIIEDNSKVIRNIPFHKGINLIVDETPETNTKQTTGNNVGKTTVLRLVDYCFGANGKNIYQDTEFKDQPNTTIEKFLKGNNVTISVELTKNLEDENSNTVLIRKNFLSYSKKIQEVNGENITNDKDFDKRLKEVIFKSEVDKPTLKQIISKNIRDEKNKMSNIVKVLSPYTAQEEYEALYLFWLGINTNELEEKQHLAAEKKKEESFQKRLKKEGELSLIEQQLNFVNGKIEELTKKRNTFNINENYSSDVEKLNHTKFNLNRVSSELSQVEMRRDLIIESKNDLEQEYTQIDTNQIKLLYDKAESLIPNLHVSFEETIKFHNDLISEKLDYITKELPELEQAISRTKSELYSLRELENELTNRLKKLGVVEDLEKIVVQLNRQFERKGSLEEQKRLWEKSIEKLERINKELKVINKGIESKDELIQSRITEFNKFFSELSNKLYGEYYLLSTIKNVKGYDLIVTNIEGNPSTGKKKGQIAAFDFAYIQFADSLDIECLHFVMHDQLESIHGNQLNTLVDVANTINGQYIVPILRDKIPENIDVSRYEVLSLSQDDKLFKVK